MSFNNISNPEIEKLWYCKLFYGPSKGSMKIENLLNINK